MIYCKGHEPKLEARYNFRYDAYYCAVCDKWLEGLCPDGCTLCMGRPEKPSEVKLGGG